MILGILVGLGMVVAWMFVMRHVTSGDREKEHVNMHIIGTNEYTCVYTCII